jgi:hypothetical protein
MSGIVILDSYAWIDLRKTAKQYPTGTLLIVVDPTRSAGGPDGPVHSYLIARRLEDGSTSDWKSI